MFLFLLFAEVPREALLFIISAFGGIVSWEGDGAPIREADESITHQIVDRPTQGHTFLTREYIQPEWVFDCVNARIILPTDRYMVGRVPPPHLSPFVDNDAKSYVLEYGETIKRLQAAAKKHVLPMPGTDAHDLDDARNLLAEGIIDRAEANEAAEKKRKMAMLEKQDHEELQLELKGSTYSVSLSNKNGEGSSEENEAKDDSIPDLEQAAEAAHNIPTVLMSRKKRKPYEAMQIGNLKKQAKVDLLKERKRQQQLRKFLLRCLCN